MSKVINTFQKRLFDCYMKTGLGVKIIRGYGNEFLLLLRLKFYHSVALGTRAMINAPFETGFDPAQPSLFLWN